MDAEKQICITTDNGSNFICACHLLNWLPLAAIYTFPLLIIQYSSTVTVLYIRDHGGLSFPDQKYHLKTSFTIPSWHLGSIG